MKSTQQYIDFDIPSWAAGLAGETGNEIPALLQRSQSSQSETEQKCQKSTFACATHSPRYFFKRRFYIFQLLISFKPSFYLSQKILVVILCYRLRFTFSWTRLDQSGPEWSRVYSPSSTVICQLPLAPPTSEEDTHSNTKPIRIVYIWSADHWGTATHA